MKKVSLYISVIVSFLCLIIQAQGRDVSFTGQEEAYGSELAATVAGSASCDNDSVSVDSLTDVDSIPPLPWPENLQARLDTIVAKASILRTSQMGLLVYDLTADTVLYAMDEHQTLRPASTMKLITAITALDKLGAMYEYKTRLAYVGTIVDSLRTLHGNLYLTGGMDPMIDKDDITAFAQAVKASGIDTICGSLYTDKSMKDADLYGEGWCWDDDNPMLSALVYARKDNMGEVLIKALDNEGITFCTENEERNTPKTGSNISEKHCPASAKVICTRTHTLADVLQPMMKRSNNLYAESVFYQIALTQGKPATAKKAKAVEEALLKRTGKGDAIHRFADGSGLSLYNYVSADIEVAFLRYAYRHKAIYDALYRTLPIAGVDGTLKDRLHRTPAAGNVHAKTGTLSGISSLAGYCTASNGHTLAFAIINQGVMRAKYAKALQDKLCIAMCR